MLSRRKKRRRGERTSCCVDAGMLLRMKSCLLHNFQSRAASRPADKLAGLLPLRKDFIRIIIESSCGNWLFRLAGICFRFAHKTRKHKAKLAVVMCVKFALGWRQKLKGIILNVIEIKRTYKTFLH